MAKSTLTLNLEKMLFKRLGRAEAGCKEVTIGWYGKEVVDFITISLDKNMEIKCFEIKVSKSDFYSKAKVTFIGNKNYYVMPEELYWQVKNDIPKEVGVFAQSENNILNNPKERLYILKKARKISTKVDTKIILSSMLRSMQREWFKEISK